jgi:aspartate/methionine/tyrosine aminotransferase
VRRSAWGAWILSDAVYRGAELDGDMSPTFWGRYDRTLVVAGLSKAFALPGLRTGWVVGPKELVREIWGYTDYTTITTGAINARLATLALRPETREKILHRNRQIASKNLKGLTDCLAKHADILRFVPPRIGGVTFIGYNLKINSTATGRPRSVSWLLRCPRSASSL